MKSYQIVSISAWVLISCILFSSQSSIAFQSLALDYDIVYVRYPAVDSETKPFVTIPQGEKPYDIAPGADLMLLHPDGSEDVLVDCTVCSVMDPVISYDGKTVYYSLIEGAGRASSSWLYKIDLSAGKPYQAVRLTYDNGFDSFLYSGNSDSKHDQGDRRGIRDMAPFPLADGRLVFTSNRAAITAFHVETDAVVNSSVQQLYVMDDHDGSLNTPAKANLHLLEHGNLHQVQHPIQLRDGRILFSTWQDVGTKFIYAMTPLFTVHPDGSNLQQFTEPHDHHRNVEHFITQLPGEHVVSAWYYPSFDYGFGVLLRYPISNPDGPDFLRGSISERYPYGDKYAVSYREFDRVGTTLLTTHTTPKDQPAPDLSGKYSMPSATKNGHMLVAYSTGSVNYFRPACDKPDSYTCESLKSGIYLIKDAETSKVTDPSQLVRILDKPEYNEIWPRAVVSYRDVHGVSRPDILPSLDQTGPADPRLAAGSPRALVGTSSMLNREPNEREERFSGPAGRGVHDGNWRVQGAEAGVFTDDDIYGVRIVATPVKPFTEPHRVTDEIKRYLMDARLPEMVGQYGSAHGERWEILGEFPLAHTDITDRQGNPDTSWSAIVPADTPFLIQTIDKNGMTLLSELAWRGLKPGEKRVDCGGCHAHSIEELDYDTTGSGQLRPIRNVIDVDTNAALSVDDVLIKTSSWDLTMGKVPLLAQSGAKVGIKKHDGLTVGVEFNRDVAPILSSRCGGCHTQASGLDLYFDGAYPNDAYGRVMTVGSYTYPQVSRYIRTPQARQSLLVWVAWGQRLDGRTNGERADDLDYPNAHPSFTITDMEKRTLARWVDMGSPIDMAFADGFAYTDDNGLPLIDVYRPHRGGGNDSGDLIVGFHDAHSGVDTNTATYRVYEASLGQAQIDEIPFLPLSNLGKVDDNGVLTGNLADLSLKEKTAYVMEVSVYDYSGNRNIDVRNFQVSEWPPKPPTSVTFEIK